MALPDAQAQRTNICMEYGHAAKIYKTMVTRQLVTGNYESFAMWTTMLTGIKLDTQNFIPLNIQKDTN